MSERIASADPWAWHVPDLRWLAESIAMVDARVVDDLIAALIHYADCQADTHGPTLRGARCQAVADALTRYAA